MSSQNYQNHRAMDQVYIAAGVIVLLALLLTGTAMAGLGGATLAYVVQLCVIVALILILLRLRGYGTKLQDRIIRLEMQVRLARLGLEDKAATLTVRQLVGLRFASDAEMPALIDTVLSEKLQKADDIKKRITDWQPDTHRI